MELYKAKLNGATFRKSKDPTDVSGQEIARIINKGELILVKKVESLTDSNLSFPYKKYTLWNGNYALSVTTDGIDAYSKASFADVPEHLFVQIKKPKVYITLGVVLVGLAVWSVIQERKNN